jgi:hypothetical protein
VVSRAGLEFWEKSPSPLSGFEPRFMIEDTGRIWKESLMSVNLSGVTEVAREKSHPANRRALLRLESDLLNENVQCYL